MIITGCFTTGLSCNLFIHKWNSFMFKSCNV